MSSNPCSESFKIKDRKVIFYPISAQHASEMSQVENKELALQIMNGKLDFSEEEYQTYNLEVFTGKEYIIANDDDEGENALKRLYEESKKKVSTSDTSYFMPITQTKHDMTRDTHMSVSFIVRCLLDNMNSSSSPSSFMVFNLQQIRLLFIGRTEKVNSADTFDKYKQDPDSIFSKLDRDTIKSVFYRPVMGAPLLFDWILANLRFIVNFYLSLTRKNLKELDRLKKELQITDTDLARRMLLVEKLEGIQEGKDRTYNKKISPDCYRERYFDIIHNACREIPEDELETKFQRLNQTWLKGHLNESALGSDSMTAIKLYDLLYREHPHIFKDSTQSLEQGYLSSIINLIKDKSAFMNDSYTPWEKLKFMTELFKTFIGGESDSERLYDAMKAAYLFESDPDIVNMIRQELLSNDNPKVRQIAYTCGGVGGLVDPPERGAQKKSRYEGGRNFMMRCSSDGEANFCNRPEPDKGQVYTLDDSIKRVGECKNAQKFKA